MTSIRITLTEFVNFVSKSGSAKISVVKAAKKRREMEDNPYCTDYWYMLRNRIVEFHKKDKTIDFLDELLRLIPDNKKENYDALINGYKKFLGKKKVKYITPIRKTWVIEDISIALNPELVLEMNKKYMLLSYICQYKNR